MDLLLVHALFANGAHLSQRQRHIESNVGHRVRRHFQNNGQDFNLGNGGVHFGGHFATGLDSRQPS